MRTVHKHRGRESFRTSYPWVKQVKLYEPNKNNVSVLDSSSGGLNLKWISTKLIFNPDKKLYHEF